MRLSISNLAWEAEYDAQVRALLGQLAVDAIDVAPGRYFPDVTSAKAADVDKVRRSWNDAHISIVGMQSLLFGTTGLNIFGSEEAQTRMLHHMAHVGRLANHLGARYLVFGSPRNRDARGWEPAAARRHAVEFFRHLADLAETLNVVFCLEANPPRYHCNFMTSTSEAAAIVGEIGRECIRLQFDIGTVSCNRENASALLSRHADLVGHIHISEPDLVPIGTCSTSHAEYAKAIGQTFMDPLVTIEMLPGSNRLESIEDAIRFTQAAYSVSHPDRPT